MNMKSTKGGLHFVQISRQSLALPDQPDTRFLEQPKVANTRTWVFAGSSCAASESE